MKSKGIKKERHGIKKQRHIKSFAVNKGKINEFGANASKREQIYSKKQNEQFQVFFIVNRFLFARSVLKNF